MDTEEEVKPSRLYRIVNAKYSLPTWLWVFASFFVGVIVLIYSLTNPALIIEFTKTLPFHGLAWSPLVVIGSLLTMVGMGRANEWLVRKSSILNFCLWVFGAVSFYAAGGIGNVLIFGAPMLIFWAYTYLAAYFREVPRL